MYSSVFPEEHFITLYYFLIISFLQGLTWKEAKLGNSCSLQPRAWTVACSSLKGWSSGSRWGRTGLPCFWSWRFWFRSSKIRESQQRLIRYRPAPPNLTSLCWIAWDCSSASKAGPEGFPAQSPNGLSSRSCILCHVTALLRSVPHLAQRSPLSSGRQKPICS